MLKKVGTREREREKGKEGKIGKMEKIGGNRSETKITENTLMLIVRYTVSSETISVQFVRVSEKRVLLYLQSDMHLFVLFFSR